MCRAPAVTARYAVAAPPLARAVATVVPSIKTFTLAAFGSGEAFTKRIFVLCWLLLDPHPTVNAIAVTRTRAGKKQWENFGARGIETPADSKIEFQNHRR